MFKVVNGGQLPTRGSKYSACVDLYANADITIGAGETVLIPLGVCIDLDDDSLKSNHYLQLMLRSSLSKELIIANGVGVIDFDYKDEIMIRVHRPIDYVTFHNEAYSNTFITKGQRVAQITLLEHKGYLFGIDTEDERNGGFGSTDIKEA